MPSSDFCVFSIYSQGSVSGKGSVCNYGKRLLIFELNGQIQIATLPSMLTFCLLTACCRQSMATHLSSYETLTFFVKLSELLLKVLKLCLLRVRSTNILVHSPASVNENNHGGSDRAIHYSSQSTHCFSSVTLVWRQFFLIV